MVVPASLSTSFCHMAGRLSSRFGAALFWDNGCSFSFKDDIFWYCIVISFCKCVSHATWSISKY